LSAALQVPLVWASQHRLPAINGANALHPEFDPQLLESAVHHIERQLPNPETGTETGTEAEPELQPQPEAEPLASWAFYRKHTENLLRRYLYASMQVGRSPNLLGESIGRGWVSSRRVRTFEDALIFVLDVERCLKRLTLLDQQLITRRFIQEYTKQEVADILGISLTGVIVKLPQALDRLTESLVESDLLVLPD
jgi:hypothetical protein